ncbi:MAG: HDOD domain-containing protein [Desulfovibrionaceae bacterium]|jgi:HD-like signal output (HDOD) protein|nr:HDOD domain-containing protein [Desulfovibrionaceae bacterium]
MGKINITSLKPGMVLADTVLDRNGRLLLGKGVELAEKHLRIMKIWGVTEADVEGVTQESVEEELFKELDPAVLEAAGEYVRSRFVNNDLEHEAVAELVRLCTYRIAEEVSASSSVPGGLVSEEAARGAADAPDLPYPGIREIDPYKLVHDDMKLGSLPMVFHKLVEVVNDSRSSASDVAEVIGNDIDLSARLLKVVNSSFYGLQSKIDTISRAVAVIGSNQLVSLAMGFSVITFFKGIPDSLINMRSFWTHSIACGIAARILASYHNTPNTERFFVAGLLHDIGRLVMYKTLPDPSLAALEMARRKDMLLFEAEREVLGFTHHKLGGIVLKRWKCPVSLEKNVQYHHEPERAPNRLEASILQFADIMANALEMGSSGERLVPRLEPSMWDTLGLPLSVISQTAAQMDYQVSEIVQFFTQEG